MSPPPAARRTALGRLADALRRRLRGGAQRAAPPATVPGLASGEETAVAAAARPEPEDADAPAEPEAELEAEPAAEPEAEAELAAEPEAEAELAAEPEPEPAAEPGARIDAARERLRAKIEPPRDPELD
ncbi:MAG: hypothetical protein QOI64_2028 [Solirubrobacteraceae bacterium]|nr:hypothetical protein [Solirubrobacteraceae bacterium]